MIAVIDPVIGERIATIETPSLADSLIVTPYAPLLAYANVEDRAVHFYNLQERSWISRLDLPIAPRHVILDTTGSRLGITDSTGGGFVLASAYTQALLSYLPEVPPAADVLFMPNEIDVLLTSTEGASLGLIDTNVGRYAAIDIETDPGAMLSPPSRSVDGRYVYVSNSTTGEVLGLNAYSRVVFRTFPGGDSPVRPYTTPQGLFLYVMDAATGTLDVYDQNVFERFATVELEPGLGLVAVGRFDRMNLFAGHGSRNYYRYDNIRRRVIQKAEFPGMPIELRGMADGETALVAFADFPKLAVVELETGTVRYVEATPNGARAFAVGLSNNVCH